MRRSATGSVRGALCGMGTCYECRVTIDGVLNERSCLVECEAGMKVRTAAALDGGGT